MSIWYTKIHGNSGKTVKSVEGLQKVCMEELIGRVWYPGHVGQYEKQVNSESCDLEIPYRKLCANSSREFCANILLFYSFKIREPCGLTKHKISWGLHVMLVIHGHMYSRIHFLLQYMYKNLWISVHGSYVYKFLVPF